MPCVQNSCANGTPFVDCCGRLRAQVFTCEQPTGCGGATFPVGFGINVNQWAMMGAYPVSAVKLVDCVGKAEIGILNAVNGLIDSGISLEAPITGKALTATFIDALGQATGDCSINLCETIEGRRYCINGEGSARVNGTLMYGDTDLLTMLVNNGYVLPNYVLDVQDLITLQSPINLELIMDPTDSLPGDLGIWDAGAVTFKTDANSIGFMRAFCDIPNKSGVYLCGTMPQNLQNYLGAVDTTYVGITVTVPNSAQYPHTYGILASFNDYNSVYAGLCFRNSADNMVWAGYFNGNIFVSGDATLGGTAYGNWADYAFDAPESLEVVKESIATRRALPGVPTAAEIKENGMGIGAGAKMLMEKIEQLYMHVIKLDERLSAVGA